MHAYALFPIYRSLWLAKAKEQQCLKGCSTTLRFLAILSERLCPTAAAYGCSGGKGSHSARHIAVAADSARRSPSISGTPQQTAQKTFNTPKSSSKTHRSNAKTFRWEVKRYVLAMTAFRQICAGGRQCTVLLLWCCMYNTACVCLLVES